MGLGRGLRGSLFEQEREEDWATDQCGEYSDGDASGLGFDDS